jgi:hypothetical protein
MKLVFALLFLFFIYFLATSSVIGFFIVASSIGLVILQIILEKRDHHVPPPKSFIHDAFGSFIRGVKSGSRHLQTGSTNRKGRRRY